MNPEKRIMELVHYGASKFRPEDFHPTEDSGWIKPSAIKSHPAVPGRPIRSNAGLWASPVGSEWGWKEWCESEQFRLDALKDWFYLRLEGNVLTIDTVGDLELLSWTEPDEPALKKISFAQGIAFGQMRRAGIDAIYLTGRGQIETRFSHPRSLYGWDCECVLVLNPSCVVQIDKDDVTPVEPKAIPIRHRTINIRHSA